MSKRSRRMHEVVRQEERAVEEKAVVAEPDSLEVATRPHPFADFGAPERLTLVEGFALEFHGPEPILGVRYLGWDGTE